MNPEHEGPFVKEAPGSGRLARFERRLKARAVKAKADKITDQVEARRLKAIRFQAYLRDHKKDRAFGSPLLFETDNLNKLAHSHHIKHKSAGGSDELFNRCTLGPVSHALHHDGLLDIDGDGNETLHFTLYKRIGNDKQVVRKWETQP